MVTQKKGKSPKFSKDAKWQWLEDAMVHEHHGFTFPQVKPSLLLLETPASLDRKVPMVPGPRDVVILSTTKLGTKRYQVPADAEFDLTEPQRPICEYNFLHDPHLKEYLNHPLVRKTLTEKGLVTKDGYVKCTIKEFNDYRQWIRKLKLNAIDQEFHRMTAIASGKNNKKDYKNNEALLLTKKRQERAKELHEKKLKKKEQDRERYIKFLEEQDERVENIKRENQRYYKERKRQRQKDRESMKRKNEENENKGRRIRFKILINSKKNIEHHKENALKLQREKIMEKEKRAEDLWNRRQSYCMEKMKDEKMKKEVLEKERKQSILQRDNIYQKERRKSDAYMSQYSKENRENALKHMEEATEFLARIEAKKEAEIEKWREKLKCIKEREKLLTYYRQKRINEKQSGKFRRRHSKSRKSVWDVDQVLLKEIMCHMTEKERKELEEFHNELSEDLRKECNKDIIEEENPEELRESEDQEVTPVSSEQSATSDAKHSGDKLEIGLVGQHKSFIVFGNITKDDTEEVYHEDTHDIEIGNDHQIFHVPGLIIEHTKSCHEHLPCVADDIDLHEIETQKEEIVKTLHDGEDEDMEITSPISSYSSYEILVIPSTHNEDINDSQRAKSTEATFIHVIDEEPVLVSSGSIMKLSPKSSIATEDEIIDTARAIVLASLASAAKNLGYSDDEIQKELGTHDDKRTSPSFSEASEIRDEKLKNYAKEITQISLIGAAVSLGYAPTEIAEALGLDSKDEGLVDIANRYEMSIKNMAQTAILNAAVSLGYTEDEAHDAMNILIDERISPCSQQSIGLESRKSNISILAAELAKSAIFNAAQKLGLDPETSENIGEFCASRTEIKEKSYLSLTSKNSKNVEEPYTVLAHNALRGAAIALGYSEDEVTEIIGEEKYFDEEDKLHNWARSITQQALYKGKMSFIEQQLNEVPCESVTTKCENYLRQYMPVTPPNSVNEIANHQINENRYTDTSENYTTLKNYDTKNNSNLTDKSIGKNEILEMEIEQVSSSLALDAIKNAAFNLGYSKEEINMALEDSNSDPQLPIETCRFDKRNDISDSDDTRLKEKARLFVEDIIKKATVICHKETSTKQLTDENAKLKKTALKFTMIMIGTALQSLGYSENQILRAINDDTKRRTGDKFKEVHPNIAVQFNEASIFRARRESLSIEDRRGRRQSIKDRPSTPKPSNEELDGTKCEPQIVNLAPQPQKKSRRPTPIFDPSFQQQIISNYEKEKKLQGEIIEEDEEEECSENDDDNNQGVTITKNSDQGVTKTKNSFTNTVSKNSNKSLLRPENSLHRDFSNLKESEILCKIKEETQKDKSVLNILSEYPTEGEFLTYARKQDQLELQLPVTNHEKSLMNLLGHEQLAPGILDLYNAIQTDITRLLSQTNSRLLCLRSNDSPSYCSSNLFSQSPQTKQILDQKSECKDIIIDDIRNFESPLAMKRPTSVPTSREKLPEIPSRNSSLIIVERKSANKSSSSQSKTRFPKSLPSLSNIRSGSSSKVRLENLTGSPSGSLPSITHSSSIIAVTQKRSDCETANEELEVVIKAPADFQDDLPLSSKYRFQATDSFQDKSKAPISKKVSASSNKPKNSFIANKNHASKSSHRMSPTPPKPSVSKTEKQSRGSSIEKPSIERNQVSQENTPRYARPLNRDSSIRSQKSPRKISQTKPSSQSVFERLSSTTKNNLSTTSKDDTLQNPEMTSSTHISTPIHQSISSLSSRQNSIEKRTSSYKVLPERLSKAPLKSQITLSPVPETQSPLKPITNSSSTVKQRNDKIKSFTDSSPSSEKPSKFPSKHYITDNTNNNKATPQKKTRVEKNSKSIINLPIQSKSSNGNTPKEKNATTSSPKAYENLMKKDKEIIKKNESEKITVTKTVSSISKQNRPKSSISKVKSENHKVTKSESKDTEDILSQQSSITKKKPVKPKRKSKKSVAKLDSNKPHNGDTNEIFSESKQNVLSNEIVVENKKSLNESTDINPEEAIEKSISVTVKSTNSTIQNTELSPSKNEVTKPEKTKDDFANYMSDKNAPIAPQNAPSSSNKQLSRKSINRSTVSKGLEKSTSKFANIASVTTLSLDFDDKLKTTNKSYSQRLLNSNVADEEDLGNKIETIANIRSSSLFEPHNQKSNSTFILSTHSLKSLSAGQASKKSIFKSRSLGSAGKVMATDSRQRHHSSSFRESLPMMPLNEQGDCTDFSNINSFIESQKHMRQSSKINSSSVMWVPSQSFAKECETLVEPSPSALLVKSANVSRQLSASSFKSGHIFVTPAASINFAAPHSDTATRDTSATSRTSRTEIVEKQISGAMLSKQNSMLSQYPDNENK